MQEFRKLDVWHKAHALTLATYRATENSPESETFALPALRIISSGSRNIVPGWKA